MDPVWTAKSARSTLARAFRNRCVVARPKCRTPVLEWRASAQRPSPSGGFARQLAEFWALDLCKNLGQMLCANLDDGHYYNKHELCVTPEDDEEYNLTFCCENPDTLACRLPCDVDDRCDADGYQIVHGTIVRNLEYLKVLRN